MALKCNPCDCTSQWYKTDWGWRKAVIDILCQLSNITPVVGGGATRNDALANTFAPAVGDASTVAVDSHGGQYLAADGHLPAGTNSIGNIGTVSTVTGVTTVSTVTTVAAVTAITNALPTGTNSIGKISDITTSIVPGTGATNLGKAEDAGHSSGDVGVMALGVKQNSSPTSLGGTSLDYTPCAVNSFGDVYVDLNVNHRESASASAIQAEDAAGIDGQAGIVALAHRKDAPVNSAGTDGDYCFLDVAADGGQWTTPTPAGWTAVSAADITDTTLTTLKAADATNKFYLTNITVSNMHATVSTRVDILDGSTVVWQGPAAANGGGWGINFVKPIGGTAATALKVQCGTTGAAVRVAVAGYTAP